MAKQTVEDYVAANWPEGVPQDCTALDENDQDCMTRDINENHYCLSCWQYIQLLQQYESELGEVL